MAQSPPEENSWIFEPDLPVWEPLSQHDRSWPGKSDKNLELFLCFGMSYCRVIRKSQKEDSIGSQVEYIYIYMLSLFFAGSWLYGYTKITYSK